MPLANPDGKTTLSGSTDTSRPSKAGTGTVGLGATVAGTGVSADVISVALATTGTVVVVG
jgi:hypothetical protein